MAPKYELIYFNGKGRGEIIRILFAVGGVKYEDTRVEFKDWPELKPKTPQGALPVLKIDGKTQIPQTQAIARYLAKEYKLYGKSNLEGLQIDSFYETAKEFFDKFATAAFSENKEEAMKKFTAEEQPKFLKLLEEAVSGSGGYVVGSVLSLADLFLFSILENMKLQDQLDSFPKLKASVGKVKENTKVQEYIKKRPDTQF